MAEYALTLGASVKNVFTGGGMGGYEQGLLLLGGAVVVIFLIYKLMNRH